MGFALAPLSGHAKESVVVVSQAAHLGIDQSSIFFDEQGVNNPTVFCQTHRSRRSNLHKVTAKNSRPKKLKRVRLDSTPDQLVLGTPLVLQDESESLHVGVESMLSPRHLVNFWSREPL